MEVYFISANNNENKKIVKIECKNEKGDILIKFPIIFEDVVNTSFEKFQENVEDMNSCTIKIKNGYIKYNYEKDSMIFQQNDLYVNIVCKCAPEILRELFCGIEI